MTAAQMTKLIILTRSMKNSIDQQHILSLSPLSRAVITTNLSHYENFSIGRSPPFAVRYLRFPREASLPWTRWLRTAVLKNRLKSRPRRDGKERRKEKAKKRQTQGLERRGEKKRESACNRRKQRCVRTVTGVWGRKEGGTRWQEEERKAWKKREKKEERRRIGEGGGVERRSEDKVRRRKK